MKHLLFTLSVLVIQLPHLMAGSNAKTLLAFYKAVDSGDITLAATYLTADLSARLPYSPEAMDLETFKGVGYALKSAIPDMVHHMDQVNENGAVVAVMGHLTGKNTGSFMGLPAMGNSINSPFQGFYFFNEKGLIREIHIVFDRISFEAQLTAGHHLKGNKATSLANVFFNDVLGGAHDLNRLNQILADHFISTDFPFPNAPKAAYIDAISSVVKGFPDIRVTITEQYAEGQSVFTAGYWEGTHLAECLGFPASGKKVKVSFMDIWKESDDKLVYNQVVLDMAGLMQQISTPPGMSYKTEGQKIMEAVSKGRLEDVTAMCHADARFHGFAPMTLDAKGYTAALTELFKAFPDYKFSLYDFIAEGDHVVARHQFEGTHTGAAFQGIPPTGRKVTIPAAATMKFKDGKVTDIWLNMYVLSFMDQLRNPGMTGK